jgi:hypothetical protein
MFHDELTHCMKVIGVHLYIHDVFFCFQIQSFEIIINMVQLLLLLVGGCHLQ